MPVITISRQFAAAGGPIGKALAQRFDAELLDREIVAQVAARAGLSEAEAEGYDERLPGLWQRIVAALAMGGPDPSLPPLPADLMPATAVHERLAQLTRAVIEEAAARGNAVILGRGGAYIVPSGRDVLHVQLHAPLEARIRYLLTRVEEIPVDTRPDEASLRELCRTFDSRRAEYVKRTFGKEWLDPDSYDLSIDTGSMGVEVAVDLIEMAARRHDPTAFRPTPEIRISADSAAFFHVLIYGVSIILGIGAMFGCFNTMYDTVEARAREIATLRVLGYGSFAVACSVILEASVLAVSGSLIGALIAWTLYDGVQGNLGWDFFTLTVSLAMFGMAVLWALAISFVGGLAAIPAGGAPDSDRGFAGGLGRRGIDIAIAQVAGTRALPVIVLLQGRKTVPLSSSAGAALVDIVKPRIVVAEDGGLDRAARRTQRLEAMLLLHVFGNFQPAQAFDLPLRRAGP